MTFQGWNESAQNILQWITASETNNAYFIVQHTADPALGFEDLGKVTGAGTTTTAQTYNYSHLTPVVGVNYYRLKQVDFDGSSETFEIRAVECDIDVVFTLGIGGSQSELYRIVELSVGEYRYAVIITI